MAVPHRLHAPRGAGAPHGQLRGPGPRAARPLPRLARRHGRALRRPAADLLPPQRLRRRRVRHRHARQLARARLRLPGRDPLLRRGGQRQPGPRRDACRTPSACTRRTPASSGSTSTGGSGTTEVRRSRRLVVSFIATVGNYEYGFYWYFYQDGTIQLEVKLTGIISNGADAARREAAVGRAGRARRLRPDPPALLQRAARHDRGRAATTRSTRSTPWPTRPGPRTRTATPSTPRRRCSAREARGPAHHRPARRRASGRSSTRRSRNRLGEPVAYKLMPGENVLPFAAPGRRASPSAPAFMTKHLWVTPPRPARAVRRRRLPEPASRRRRPARATCADDAPLENTDVVVWYTFGAHHVVRPEDWPVMPVDHDRLHAQARRLLRPQPRARRAPPDATRRLLRARLAGG